MARLACPCGKELRLSGSGRRDFTYYSDATADAAIESPSSRPADTLDIANDGDFHECAECGRLLFFPKGEENKALVYVREGHAALIGK